MKFILKKIKSSGRPLLQIVILGIIFTLPSIIDGTGKIIPPQKLAASKSWVDYAFYIVWTWGNKALGVFLAISFLFLYVRKQNKSYMFNKGALYNDHTYIWYWICAKILGYSKCSLIRVPIYMQFKLIINDTFDEYYCGDYSTKTNDPITIQHINFGEPFVEVNLIIADTYPLYINQIPTLTQNKPTIIISRDNSQDNNRYNSPELVEGVVNEVRKLPVDTTNINIFATTNPLNTKKIVENAFKMGERSTINVISVFQQNVTSNSKLFELNGKKVYEC